MTSASATPEGVAEPMRSRRSPSLFDPTHQLTDGEITQLLQAAQWAPSWGNTQPWNWLILRRDSEGFEQLLATLTPGNRSWVPRVSVVFVSVIQVVAAGDTGPSPYAAFDTGQASAHLTLQAQAMGLAAHQFAGFDAREFARLMAVPPTHQVLAGVAVGRIGDPARIEGVSESILAKDARARIRRPLNEQAFGAGWGRPWRTPNPQQNGTDR